MASNIRQGIRKDMQLLSSQPYMGKEIQLADRTLLVFVSVNYKIIYGVNDNLKQVYVYEVFDSRQSPDKLNP